MPSPPPREPSSPSERRRAVLWLSVACIAWGWGFPAVKAGTAAMTGIAPEAGAVGAAAAFIGWRFLLAALIYGLWTWSQQRNFTRLDVLGGLALGGVFVAGLLLQLVGLQYTLPSVSAFLTALYVVLLPLSQTLFLGRPPSRALWLAVVLALAGLTVLGVADAPPVQADAPFSYFGEILTLLSAILFTVQILCLDYFGPRANVERLTWLMFCVSAAGGLAVSVAWPGAWRCYAPEHFRAFWLDPTFQWSVATTTIFSAVVSFHLMNRYQPSISPTLAGVIYCLEPVFATGASVLLAMEELRWSLFLGGGLILGAILLAVSDRRSSSKAKGTR